MPTLVCVHAHPDDEAIFTGGTILQAVRAGWRVVVVFATSGEEGAPAKVDTGRCRREEATEAGRLLGVSAVHFLGYRDSGMPANGHPESLAASDLADAAGRLGRILADERAAAITSYDANGIYGHPDHVRVHQIAALAAGEGVEVYEATLSRPELSNLRRRLVARGLDQERWPEALVLGSDDGDLIGVDVTEELPAKLAAMAAHASQIAETPAFMGVPAGAFHQLLTTEWFRPARVGEGQFLELLAVPVG